MSEKRFVDYFDKDHNYIIQDLQNEDEYQVGFVNCDEDVFLELVNKIADENEQLKSKNRGLQSELQIFKEDVTHSNLQINKLADENEQLKRLLEDCGLLMSDEEVINVRTEIADKLIKPLCKGNGFDVDVDCTDGFTIIPKKELQE